MRVPPAKADAEGPKAGSDRVPKSEGREAPDGDEGAGGETVPCKFCGEPIRAAAKKCRFCGEFQKGRGPARSGGSAAGINPPLTEAILVTLCCCLPFGIVGIIYAANAKSALAQGRIEDAQKAAATAKTWVNIGFVLGLILNGLNVLLQVLAAGAR